MISSLQALVTWEDDGGSGWRKDDEFCDESDTELLDNRGA